MNESKPAFPERGFTLSNQFPGQRVTPWSEASFSQMTSFELSTGKLFELDDVVFFFDKMKGMNSFVGFRVPFLL